WIYPKKICETMELYQGELVNISLDGSPSFLINSMEIAAISHGISGEVIGNEYFGTDKFINQAVCQWQGFGMDIDLGYVNQENFERDSCGIITGIKFN